MEQNVRFPNDACSSSGGRSGTCYTLGECRSRGGSPLGQCAGGFGACCVASAGGCGGRTAENRGEFHKTYILIIFLQLYCRNVEM